MRIMRHSIPLHPSYLRTHGPADTQRAIRQIVRSVDFELIEAENAFRILGPEMSYLQVDPYLPGYLSRYGRGLTLADVASYRSSTRHYDLYFEDSWTGYFIAQLFERSDIPQDLVLIHLDDHEDMMPTLLCVAQAGLTDPTSGRSFDSRSSADWERAIGSGVIGIGNHITPLFYSGINIHCRHLSNNAPEEALQFFAPSLRHYDLIPDLGFAAITRVADGSATYLKATDVRRILAHLPRADTIVHVDLDYFINDFNGRSRGEDYVPDDRMRQDAETKLDDFFSGLEITGARIARWLIGTSPGFCSAYHWTWLLGELARRIEQYALVETRMSSVHRESGLNPF